MDERTHLAMQFEAHRRHLRAVAYRMLGSLSDADDAVQEAWLRLSRSDTSGVANLGGWLTTVTGRICLDMLRSRTARREEELRDFLPEPVVARLGVADPEDEAVLADMVGLALLVVLETLSPAERLAFVLHDLFAVPFDEIGRMLERSPNAAKQLASRARQRVRGAEPPVAGDLDRQREVVEAFLAAAREGDFDRLVAVLHPDVVLRVEGGRQPVGSGFVTVRGAETIARQALAFAHFAPHARLALVNGGIGTVVVVDGQPVSVSTFRIEDGKIAGFDIFADPERVRRLDLSAFGAARPA